MSNQHQPELRLYIGGTGSGKGVAIRQALAAEKRSRLMIWDPMHEYEQWSQPAPTMASMVDALTATGHVAVAWRPSGGQKQLEKQFDIFCRAAYAAGNLTMIVEELSQVTSANHAPTAWARCAQQGRHRGLKIWAATQRPASCDKDYLSGTTLVRAHAMRYPNDRAATAAVMGIDVSEIGALETRADGHSTTINFIEKNFLTGEVLRESITLTRTGSPNKTRKNARKQLTKAGAGLAE